MRENLKITEHKYTWFTSDWNSIPKTLQELEEDGWEIFTVAPVGGSDYCHVVCRKPKEEK